MKARFAALVVVVGCASAACASGTSDHHPAAAQPTTPTTAPATPQPTVTVTVPPAPTTTITTAPAPAPAPAASPATVVSAFYAAINAQDYSTAWRLGGDNLGMSYNSFAAGFAGTAHDNLVITGVQGNNVQVHLEALQTDGSTKVYDGFYVVANGAITEGHLTQIS